MATYLDRIAEFHRDRASSDERPWHERAVARRPQTSVDFLTGANIAVIAEVKRQSPSAGVIADVDPAEQAATYVESGASAISVLTDGPHFGGSLVDLSQVARRVAGRVPVLRKDFTVSENDVLDAAEAGAGLVLLIATILSDDELVRFDRLASDLGLMSLFEVHDETELRRVEAVGAHLIGVNQRDLHSFTIDPTRAARVRQSARTSAHFVCESGLRSVQDVAQAAANGFDAVLIGETLMRAGDQLPELLQAMSTIRKI